MTKSTSGEHSSRGSLLLRGVSVTIWRSTIFITYSSVHSLEESAHAEHMTTKCAEFGYRPYEPNIYARLLAECRIFQPRRSYYIGRRRVSHRTAWTFGGVGLIPADQLNRPRSRFTDSGHLPRCPYRH
ncbi:hypothetical protein CGRA01v4_01936 [Colletotrichum graminicola]|nr:hypothetical protein CGRA01v4_01936 [Colletotrichum graminicola]